MAREEIAAGKAAQATRVVATEAKSWVSDVMKVLFLHELLDLKTTAESNLIPGTAADPAHKKDQYNELAMAHLLVFFQATYPLEYKVLNQALKKMCTSDYKLLSLSVLEHMVNTCATYPDTAEHTGEGKAYCLIEFSIVTEKGKKGEGGKEGGKKETKALKKMPNLNFKDNYQPVMQLLAESIKQTNHDCDKFIARLMQSGLISQSALAKVARSIKNTKNLGKVLKKINEFGKNLDQAALPTATLFANWAKKIKNSLNDPQPQPENNQK